MTSGATQQSRDKKNKLLDPCKLRKAQSLVSIAYKRFPIKLMKIAGSLILFAKLNFFFLMRIIKQSFKSQTLTLTSCVTLKIPFI